LWLLCLVLSVLAGLIALPRSSSAQQSSEMVVEGYITAVHIPAGFDVNGERVLVSRVTGYGTIGERTTSTDDPLRNAVSVGAYVQVIGAYDYRQRTANAKRVFFRDDWDKNLVGVGVIERVISPGSEPVYEADGYRIRVTSSTQVSFGGGLKSLSDVGENVWLHYEGKRDKDGAVVAATAKFIPPKPSKVKGVRGLEVRDFSFQPPIGIPADSAIDAKSQSPFEASVASVPAKDGRVKLAALGAWHTVPADPKIQAHVRRVGWSVVPAYQKQLPDDDPSKINFRFYAVDAPTVRDCITSYDGLIMIPVQTLERLKNDDQVAAILADGVAFNLQRQGARLVVDNRAFLGLYAATAFVPVLGAASLVGGSIAGSRIKTAFDEERGRIALALLADAGYDPYQAPEAWRLVAPKDLPRDIDSLKYTSLGGYQLSILNLQYKRSTPGVNEPAVNSASGNPR
jgi:hypothetical protein